MFKIKIACYKRAEEEGGSNYNVNAERSRSQLAGEGRRRKQGQVGETDKGLETQSEMQSLRGATVRDAARNQVKQGGLVILGSLGFISKQGEVTGRINTGTAAGEGPVARA